MLTLHHLNNSRSQRILWLLEELEVNYDIKRYQRNSVTMLAPSELLEVHPLGKSPVITDNGVTVAESGAIVEYLVQHYGNGRFVPARESSDFLRYQYWLHYAEGSAMPPLLLKLVFDRIESERMPFFAKPVARAIAQRVKASFIQPQIARHLDYMENELVGREWFAGAAFSAADIQISFPLEAAAARGGLDRSRPNLMNFLERIHARPAYRKALERGGPYEMAK